MPTRRRTGSTVAGALPVVEPFAGARRQGFLRRGFGKPGGGRRQVVQNPVSPGRLRSIRIIDDEDQALGGRRYAAPGNGRRRFGLDRAFAGIAQRDLPLRRKGGGAQTESGGAA